MASRYRFFLQLPVTRTFLTKYYARGPNRIISTINPTPQDIRLTVEQSLKLERLDLHFKLPEHAIIYILCGYALALVDDRVGRHLREKHAVSEGARRKLNALINSLQLLSPKTLPNRPDGSIPYLYLQV